MLQTSEIVKAHEVLFKDHQLMAVGIINQVGTKCLINCDELYFVLKFVEVLKQDRMGI